MADFKYIVMKELTEKDLRHAFFSAIKIIGEGYNGEYFKSNYPNIEEYFKDEFDEWLEEFKNECKDEFDYSTEDIKTINDEINKIEESQIIDDEFKLIKLKKLLTEKINNL